MGKVILNRRNLLRLGTATLASAALSGCKVLDPLGNPDNGLRGFMSSANRLTMDSQRALIGERLAREYLPADIRGGQRPNGTIDPQQDDYLTLKDQGFASYHLEVGGAVAKPMRLSLAEIHALPQRQQITRHDCVEGWSAIAKWQGVPLAEILNMVQPMRTARYAVFQCFDVMESSLSGPVYYYESIDLRDARHAQTILAHRMNDAPLPVANGAPLRLRVERQLGYKMAKYLRSITLVAGLDNFGTGRGGYWEDRGYDWYAGI